MSVMTLLLIDDEASVRYSIQRALSSDSVQVKLAENGRSGIAAIADLSPDVVLLDIRLPDMSGLEVLQAIRAIDQRLPVVVITAHGTTDTAIEAIKRGAFDYLLKPFDLPNLRWVVDRAFEASRLARRPTIVDNGDSYDPSGDVVVGRSRVMNDVFKAIGRVADSEVNVLLLGESGSGKELVARAIYQHSKRSQRCFSAINCAAIPETLLESELFGHEKGAFTGADQRRIGRFEQATGGTIFLDEIGDMNPALQAKILRVLQDQRFERVGGHETIQTDVRVIAATNQNLTELVSVGRFRQDLYYRLNTYTIALPPLRARGDDLLLLVDYFIKRHAPEMGKAVHSVAPETMRVLAAYHWPGNVRELQGAIKTALLNSISDVLTPDCLPATISEPPGGESLQDSLGASRFDLTLFVKQLIASRTDHVYRHVLFAVDRITIGEALQAVDGNQVEAARLLGISRTTLRTKLDGFAGADCQAAISDSARPDQ